MSSSTDKTDVTTVYVVMVADLFHYGHVEFLKKARAFGDRLVVGVLPDRTVEEYKRQPVMTLEERIRVVAACRYVDEVVEHKQHAPAEWYANLGIDIRVHALGDESERRRKARSPHQAGLPTRYEVPYEVGISTTEIIGRIRRRIADGSA
ncbi:MAG: adenylyltransferase/cytidyltransferase family protein [Pseudomonadota bacterium]